MEFDPQFELELVHPPLPWQDPQLFMSDEQFLDDMKPLLNEYLSAHGEQAIRDVEWQVRWDSITEHGRVCYVNCSDHPAAVSNMNAVSVCALLPLTFPCSAGLLYSQFLVTLFLLLSTGVPESSAH